MTDVSVDSVRAFIVDTVKDQLLAAGLAPDQVGDDFDLVSTGTIDSMGLLELLAAVQERFGGSADLEEMDTEEVGVLGPFARHLATQAALAAER